MITVPQLIQFRFSHFNEKARWALDFKGIPHSRRTVLPGLQTKELRRISGQRKVPVLLMDGRVIHDSTHIIAALEEKHPQLPLYPSDEKLKKQALEWEEFFDEEVGPCVRDVMFYIGMSNTGFVARCFAGHRGFLFQKFYQCLLLMSRKKTRKYLNLTPETFKRNCDKIRAGLARIEKEQQPGGYLVGDAFSIADLSAAALLSPLAKSPHNPHQPPLPYPQDYLDLTHSFEGPGLEWVRDIYATHRGMGVKKQGD